MKTPIRLACALLLATVSSTAGAFSVNPMVAELDPNSPRSQQVFVLTNTTDKERPIEISVAKPQLDENGTEILVPDVGEELFLIIPQQFVLPPNSRRSVKVLYVGDPMEEEDTYRLLFKELPVALAQGETLPEGESSFNMRVVMQYYTRVWLTPSGLEERLAVSSFDKIEMETPISKTIPSQDHEAESAAPAQTMPMLAFTVSNDGLRHGYLRYPTLEFITRDGQSVKIAKDDLKNVSGQVIMKQSQKEFKIPWQASYPDPDDIAQIRLQTAKR